MVITSESKKPDSRRYGKTQFRYAMIYVFITFLVLLFLNIYSSNVSQRVFYQSKESSMIEKALLTAAEIADLEVLNPTSAAQAVAQMESLRVTRLIITDQRGMCVYDSLEQQSALGDYVLFPEIVTAMESNDVFTWRYHDGAMYSYAATPVFSYGKLIGCVYMMEYDVAQGKLIRSLQQNTLFITIILEIVVILFSLTFANTFSGRLNKIMESMHIIQNGDYSHKVNMGGQDELTFLGEEFNDLTDKLQESEEQRRRFVSDASHELKTPLASIKLLSDSILQNNMDEETIREFVADIGDEAERLNRMSQRLLSLARVDGQEILESELLQVAPVAQRVLKMLSVIADKGDITLRLEVIQDCTLLITEDDLYQIIFNLAENGIKYNRRGGTLTVSISKEGEYCIIRFSDTGMGIPEESLSHLFERFYRVDKARSRASGGSGLGLSIVRSMVRRYDGEITVESTLGEGSTFTVIFPIFDTEEEDL